MTQRQLNVGDRVLVNSRNVAYEGRKGTVKFMSGGQVWLALDDEGPVGTGFFPWTLEPLAEGGDNPGR